jgi:hypothetical protein
VNDFDFLIGTCDIHNRVKRADGGWDEFPGVNVGTRHLDGQSVVDEFTATLPNGREVNFLDVHVYDPDSGEWTNTIHTRGSSPDWAVYRGRFEAGVGVFEKAHTLAVGAGLSYERHTWDQITEDSARLRQEVSADGQEWETNWEMELTRRHDDASPEVD